MKDKLLILDLDETLIHSMFVGYETPSYNAVMNGHKLMDGKVLTLIRPNLEIFLKYAFENFKVAVWTAAGEKYAEEVLDLIEIDKDDLEFFYTEKNCTPKYNYTGYGKEADLINVKNLHKLKRKGYDLDEVLMVDDKPIGLSKNYGNVIRIKPYFGNTDEELLKLIDYLDVLRFKKNIRNIEKRGWELKY